MREKLNTPISGKEPEFFIKTADCVVGPDQPIVYDAEMSKKIDCETELAVVIGKPGRHIPLAAALDHVFGYTIVNDVTARDRQVRKSPEGSIWYELGRSKSFDTSAPLGPMIVTADEIGDPQSLKLQTRINGELRQSSNTRDMIWSCADLVHFFSTNFTLRPGMVIITGTPSGTAWSTDRELGGKWQGSRGWSRRRATACPATSSSASWKRSACCAIPWFERRTSCRRRGRAAPLPHPYHPCIFDLISAPWRGQIARSDATLAGIGQKMPPHGTVRQVDGDNRMGRFMRMKSTMAISVAVSAAAAAVLALAAVPARPSDKTVKIGFISTFSGPPAAIGNDMKNAFELGARSSRPQARRPAGRGDLCRRSAKPEVGVQKTQKLIESDNVDFVVGYIWSNVLWPRSRNWSTPRP